MPCHNVAQEQVAFGTNTADDAWIRSYRDRREMLMTQDPMRAETDVLVIGSGAAGMYAAIEAARGGCQVLLADRSLIGRGGATVMAQMTVAVALGSETPDHWSHHYDDTLAAGRGLCNEPLAQLLVRGRARVHPRHGRLGRRLGAQRWAHRTSDGARP